MAIKSVLASTAVVYFILLSFANSPPPPEDYFGMIRLSYQK